MKKIIILSLLSFQSFSQEIISDLISNPNLEDNKINYYKSESSLSLPFIDDFSNNSSYPETNLWQDNSVFVNRNYGINPITIGVATFDGLNKFGRAYDINPPDDPWHADTLTSQKIDLSNIDTAYLMFFYQPQGIGNDPQISDSLILEFSAGLDNSGNVIWNKIWSQEGSFLHEFKKYVMIFSDSMYLVSDFQFRFRNLATVSGNFDHWNLDYVKLNEYYLPNDTSTINDVAFVRNTPMLLNRYREMPWIHFVNDVSAEMNDSIEVILRNNTSIIQSIDYRYDIFKDDNLVYHYPVSGGNNSTRNVDVPPFEMSGTYAFNSPPIMLDHQMFPVNSSDSAEFLFRNSIKTEPFDFKHNDTISHMQRFYSHFAYDDASAESAYGINVQGAKIAYEFKLNRPDTLRIIQIKFVEMHDDLTNNKFVLMVWENNNGEPGQELYKDTVSIEYQNRGQFQNYYLKNGVGLIGTFFVGWKQITNEILNLGMDKNSVSNNYMMYDIGGGWINSQFPGSWMIRPVLNYNGPILSSIEQISEIECAIYPNPFFDKTSIYFRNNQDRSIQLFDITGRLVQNIFTSNLKVDIYNENLKQGVYFIRITQGYKIITKKLILN